MGWTYSRAWRTRAQLVAYLTSFERMGREWTVLRSIVKPSETGHRGTLWTVNERKADGYRFIGCDLLDDSHSDGWGYKDLSESMGPNETTCPLSFLALVPVPDSEWAEAWRERVRSRHAEARISIEQLRQQMDFGGAFDGVGTVYSDADPGL